MPKLPVPFGEWRPDVALLDTQFASEAENVYPGPNSYKPFPSLAHFSATSLTGGGGNDIYTKVLLHFNGTDASTTITDSNTGGSAHTWSVAGNAQIDTAQYRFSTASGLFDGTGDWVTTPDHADFTLGSSDWTIDCWVRPNIDGTDIKIAGQGNSGGDAADTPWRIIRGITNKIQATVSNGTLHTTLNGTVTSVVTGAWYHIALVRSGNTLTLYVNGTLEATTGFSGTLPNSTYALRVGQGGEATLTPWNGWIDEFRMSVGVARWTNNFTVPSASYFASGGTPCGLYAARTSGGEWKIYAGTTGKLLVLVSGVWTDISSGTGTGTAGAYAVTSGQLWRFAQFGSKLIAVTKAENPQVVDVDSGGNFAALGGSPPKAGNVHVISDFVVLSALVEGGAISGTGVTTTNRTIIWSSLAHEDQWTIGTNLCDMQVFPDCGQVMGTAGSEIGYVVQDRGIRSVQFLPGDTTYIFNFTRILHDRGCISKYGFVSIGNVLYFVSEDGFYAIAGQEVKPIGADKVNDWWLEHSDPTKRDRILAFSFVDKPRIAWAYHSAGGTTDYYDSLIIFDWSNQRWSHVTEQAYVWAVLSSINLDLDTDSSEPGDAGIGSLDSTALSLDSFAYIGGRPLIGGIDENGFLSVLNGPNLAATMETVEAHLNPGQRSFVSAVYPVVDNSVPGNGLDPTAAVAGRERLQNPLVWSTAVPLEVTGSCSILNSSRLHRFRVFVPANAQWTHGQGVQVEAQPDGEA